MTISATVVADSISPAGKRLTTQVMTYPRKIHAELMTHRDFSRNASSSRAIPVAKMLADVRDNPAVPIHWGANQPGMQARAELEGVARDEAFLVWTKMCHDVMVGVERLVAIGLHKQEANRPLEPFGHITVLVTATEWPNFYGQRCSPQAEPHMERLAEAMLAAANASEPAYLEINEWHRPFITQKDIEWAEAAVIAAKKDGHNDIEHPEFTCVWWLLNKISVARCARVSYKNHDQTDPNPAKDIELYEMLLKNHHMSPFEHVARPDSLDNGLLNGNFKGWEQWRKFIGGERIEKFDRYIVKSAERARMLRYNIVEPCGVYGCKTPRLKCDLMCPSCEEDYRKDPEAYK